VRLEDQANGAGKTTLFDVVCGQQMADSGTIRDSFRST
jgi:ABC-type multidrug transport system ATPase subunit